MAECGGSNLPLQDSRVPNKLREAATQMSLVDLFLDCLQIDNQLTHSVLRPLLVEFLWSEF